MSFIQFESASAKEKIRQELRAERAQLLEKAKHDAEERAQRESRKKLSGESDWMLPTIAKKLDKQSKAIKKAKKQKKAKKSKKSSKKRKQASNSSDSDDSSDEYLAKQKKSHKKSKKRKKKHSHKYSSSSSSSTSSDTEKEFEEEKRKIIKPTSTVTSTNEDDEHVWVERPSAVTQHTTLQRDSWMTDTLMLKTFSRERAEKKPNEKQQIDAYDPAKSARELNPYWKSTGTGLPAFQKPNDNSDNEQSTQNRSKTVTTAVSRNWQKRTTNETERKDQRKRSRSATPVDSTSDSSNDSVCDKNDKETSKFLTDQQMNELSAKIVKAEIMGNQELAAELKKKLENARLQRATVVHQKHKQHTQHKQKAQSKLAEEHVLLTHTDERGNTRPLPQSKTVVDPRDLYGGRSGRKKKEKRVETHLDGNRVRFFADDDKYDIKQMFEREKYATAAESNLQFADIASKHKNPNDDLEDIFADKIRKTTTEQGIQQAIDAQKRLEKNLENCEKCFDSAKMDKQLMVSLGQKVYLALPWHIGLQAGHCIIATIQHISCSTLLDEDAWEEVNNFRRALTRMFAAQRKTTIFYEVANKLQRNPHLCIHCVPIDDAYAGEAQGYFKKAIQESEYEWSVNKQLVLLNNTKGLRNCIPKGLPYFWVNFGMDKGYAHVIEDQERFPVNFAEEILVGMLDIGDNKWRPRKEKNTIAKVKIFDNWWKKYDCTE